MKIGVITLPFGPNYGWQLQAYALQTILTKLGHTPILIERQWDITQANNTFFYKIFRPIYYNICCGKLYRFYKKHIKTTRTYRINSDLRNVVTEYGLDAVIVGSDQVWRIEDTTGVGYNFFLDFVDSNTIKLSYAASFGNDRWQGNDKDNLIVSELLHKFSAVSVRETSGIDICRKYFDIDATCVLDPTLLLDQSDYDKLLKNPNKYRDKHLLATYILDPATEKNIIVERIRERKNLQIEPLFITTTSRFHIYKSMENWLSKIRNAEYVVVDSFHGLVFCIIFKKDFIAIANKQRGNTRFVNILKLLKMEDRLIYGEGEFSDALLNPIDYNKVYALLQTERDKSISYLLQALKK